MHSNLGSELDEGDPALAEIVAEIEAAQATIARAEAARLRALGRAGRLARERASGSSARVRAHDMALREIAAEISGAMRSTDRSVQRQIGEAEQLVEQYPLTVDALETNAITRSHVRAIVEAGLVLAPEQRGAFESLALAECEIHTPGRARARLDMIAEQLHPRTPTERHRDAREGRRVRVLPLADGMADLCATLPIVLADAIFDRLTQQARGVVDARGNVDARENTTSNDPISRHPDTRTMDQIRTDVLADMLLTAAPDADPTRLDDGPGTLGAIRAKVQVVVPALALTGGDAEAAQLIGRSPIDAETARALAGATRSPWERVLTHPVTGAVLHVDTYHRTTAIDRHLRARDQHCRFPGCRVAAVRCEVDHTVDHALGGTTDVANLAHLCQRHHSMKQFTRWRVRQRGGGVLEWTSPLGRVYIDDPPSPAVHFPHRECLAVGLSPRPCALLTVVIS